MKENMQRSANRGVDLLELLQNLWRSASIIFLGAVVIATLTFLATKLLVVPTYQAKFTAYVNNKSESTTTLSSSDLSASQYLTNTFAEIVNSRSVLESAAKRANVPFDFKSMRSAVSVSIASNTQIMTIRVVLRDPEQAYAMADALSRVTPDYASEIVEGSSMKVIDYPVMETKPYGPHVLKNTVIGFVVGLILMAAAMVIRFLTDTTVKSHTELEEKFNLPIIGIIPDIKVARKAHNHYGGYYGKPGRHEGA